MDVFSVHQENYLKMAYAWMIALRDSTPVLEMFAPLVLFLDADYVLKLHALSVIY